MNSVIKLQLPLGTALISVAESIENTDQGFFLCHKGHENSRTKAWLRKHPKDGNWGLSFVENSPTRAHRGLRQYDESWDLVEVRLICGKEIQLTYQHINERSVR